MKKLFFLTLISIFTLQAAQTKTSLIKLITADNREFNVPEEIAFLSPTIKDFVSSGMELEEAEQKQVTFNEISSATLQQFYKYSKALMILYASNAKESLGKLKLLHVLMADLLHKICSQLLIMY